MSVINRRNAVLGWVVWQGTKRYAKLKASNKKPSVQGGRPNKSLLALSLAGVSLAGIAGALTFWRKHQTAAES
jgi:hypothetical protein